MTELTIPSITNIIDNVYAGNRDMLIDTILIKLLLRCVECVIHNSDIDTEIINVSKWFVEIYTPQITADTCQSSLSYKLRGGGIERDITARIDEAYAAYAARIAQFNDRTQTTLTNIVYSDRLFLGQPLDYYFARVHNAQAIPVKDKLQLLGLMILRMTMRYRFKGYDNLAYISLINRDEYDAYNPKIDLDNFSCKIAVIILAFIRFYNAQYHFNAGICFVWTMIYNRNMMSCTLKSKGIDMDINNILDYKRAKGILYKDVIGDSTLIRIDENMRIRNDIENALSLNFFNRLIFSYEPLPRMNVMKNDLDALLYAMGVLCELKIRIVEMIGDRDMELIYDDNYYDFLRYCCMYNVNNPIMLRTSLSNYLANILWMDDNQQDSSLESLIDKNACIALFNDRDYLVSLSEYANQYIYIDDLYPNYNRDRVKYQWCADRIYMNFVNDGLHVVLKPEFVRYLKTCRDSPSIKAYMSHLIAHVVFDYKYRKAKIPYIPLDVRILILNDDANHECSEFYNENHELIMVDPNMIINPIRNPSTIYIGNYGVNSQDDMLKAARNIAPFMGANKYAIIRMFTMILTIIVITIVICVIVTKHSDNALYADMYDYALYQNML